MRKFTTHITKRFYEEANEKAKEIEEMYASDTSGCTARLDFTNQMLEYKTAYLKGIYDTLMCSCISLAELDVSWMELTTELDKIIGDIANGIKCGVKKESK